MIKKRDAVRFLGGSANAAGRALGISHVAVLKWPDELPRSAERRVRKHIADFLKLIGPAR